MGAATDVLLRQARRLAVHAQQTQERVGVERDRTEGYTDMMVRVAQDRNPGFWSDAELEQRRAESLRVWDES